jgi:hypothetical protein
MLLQAEGTMLVGYLIVIVLGFLISLYLLRWIFEVDKNVKQNRQIIDLLTLIARKHGVTEDELHGAIFKSKRK